MGCIECFVKYAIFVHLFLCVKCYSTDQVVSCILTFSCVSEGIPQLSLVSVQPVLFQVHTAYTAKCKCDNDLIVLCNQQENL